MFGVNKYSKFWMGYQDIGSIGMSVLGSVASNVVGGMLGGGGGGGQVGAQMGQAAAGYAISAEQAAAMRQAGIDASKLADPFARDRTFYMDQLKSLFQDPNMLLKTPLYEAQMESGLDAINRSAGAKGQLGSGNRLTALMDYGQGVSTDLFKLYYGALAPLAQQGSSPYGSGSLLMQGVQGTMQPISEQAAQGGFMGSQIGNWIGQGINTAFGNYNAGYGTPNIHWNDSTGMFE